MLDPYVRYFITVRVASPPMAVVCKFPNIKHSVSQRRLSASALLQRSSHPQHAADKEAFVWTPRIISRCTTNPHNATADVFEDTSNSCSRGIFPIPTIILKFGIIPKQSSQNSVGLHARLASQHSLVLIVLPLYPFSLLLFSPIRQRTPSILLNTLKSLGQEAA